MQRGVLRGGREGDQLPVNILLVSFQDIVAVVVKKKKVEKKRSKSKIPQCVCAGC